PVLSCAMWCRRDKCAKRLRSPNPSNAQACRVCAAPNGIASPRPSLERDLVVDLLVVAALASALAATRRAIAVASSRVLRLVVLVHAGRGPAAGSTRVQHGQDAVEVLQHHLGGVAVLAVLPLPLARLQLALDVDLGALLQVLLGDPAQALVEN